MLGANENSYQYLKQNPPIKEFPLGFAKKKEKFKCNGKISEKNRKTRKLCKKTV